MVDLVAVVVLHLVLVAQDLLHKEIMVVLLQVVIAVKVAEEPELVLSVVLLEPFPEMVEQV